MENNINLKKAYAEVEQILSYMDSKYTDKIPNKLKNFFSTEKLEGYIPTIEPKVPLNEQKLERKTLALLAMLNYNYWCETTEEKQELYNIYAENDKKAKEEYSTENLFNNLKAEKEQKEVLQEKIEENIAMIEYKEKSFFSKILDKIMKFFRKNN